jgi:hypothetical protein
MAPTASPAAARHRNWEASARDTVGMLLMAAGRNPDDSELTAVVGELATHSSTFRQYWSKHHVYAKSTGLTQLSHPEFGDIDLTFIAWTTPATPKKVCTTQS